MMVMMMMSTTKSGHGPRVSTLTVEELFQKKPCHLDPSPLTAKERKEFVWSRATNLQTSILILPSKNKQGEWKLMAR
jgi:hypothetical protein